MGVRSKLVQFVVYCVLFVMMSTNIEKNSAVSKEGHVLTAYGFYLIVSLASGQYADQELLKSLCQNKTPDLNLKYIYFSKCMTSRVSSKNKEKTTKRKNSVKKKRPNTEKKDGTKKQKTASPGIETGLTAGASNSLTTAPQ